jgi:hypothetical protein
MKRWPALCHAMVLEEVRRFLIKRIRLPVACARITDGTSRTAVIKKHLATLSLHLLIER